MRVLDRATKEKVRQAIDANIATLRAAEGFVSAEPGFPIVDGTVRKEPAVLVFVRHKKSSNRVLPEDLVPRQIGEYPVFVMQADPLRQVMTLEDHADVAARVTESASDLTYEKMEGNPIDASFTVSTPILCHVGPDAGWPVLKPFIEATEKTLSVAMYDFNADYIAKTFIDTVRGGEIEAVLTWDNGMTAPETQIRTKIRRSLKEQLDGWIVQCGNGYRFANAYHEKVAVRDSSSFWLSSGNWSLRSQPDIDPIGDPSSARGMYSKGNREWHVIVEDERLAKLFEKYIKYDAEGSKAEADGGDHGAVLEKPDSVQFPDLFVPIDELAMPPELAAPPTPTAPATLPSTPHDFDVRPLLTPDNYVGRIMELLKSAKRSIYLQFAYINYSDREGDEEFTKMLEVLAEASYRPNMDVRIIVGSSGASDKIRALVEAGFNEKVFRPQRNIHNKGIIVDGKIVLVSSANWSSDGVIRNRDAGVIIEEPEIARYFQDVFLDDWDNRANPRLGDDPPVTVAKDDQPTPAGMVRMSWRDYYG
ncbi:phospholipase [Bradyrhizobium manausense]|uniref:phospholipase D-like domain-containing protein n=1 Tax=Bradyrhizobium manausense TaxID=989370 RepID=UPI001BA9452C|nr:phospholipase D-like domain-containing protein [Bradyrhizobium manausense]MBR0684446.1 phospholipase [Bradyrhizobium manausense]